MMTDPLVTLYIGLFAGLLLGYVIGTAIWFRRSGKRSL